jgi:deoxyribodipyrimidine photo-lyase
LSTAIAWFRRDLRLADNPALAAAARDHDAVAPVFCFEPALTGGRHASPNRNAYLLACLAELDESLRAIGGRLLTRSGDPARARTRPRGLRPRCTSGRSRRWRWRGACASAARRAPPP